MHVLNHHPPSDEHKDTPTTNTDHLGGQSQRSYPDTSSDRTSSRASDLWKNSRSLSPAVSTSSTTTSARTSGGWSEGSAHPSPDTGRQYLQLLTQTKPSTLQRRTYQLVVTQHPHTAGEFGLNDMARIPLAPPLFVELVVRDGSGSRVAVESELPFLVARITLHQAAKPEVQDLPFDSELYGTTISAPDNLRDMDSRLGTYFIFPDVGIRRRGLWRLHVSLLRINLAGSANVMASGDASPCLAGAWTDPIEVLSAEGYVAPQITPLTRHFQNQGVRMFISNSVVPR